MSWESLKEEGNNFFRNKDYEKAIAKYSQALGKILTKITNKFNK